MVILLSSTNILDGNLIPFLNDSKRQDLFGEMVKSWKPKGMIFWNRLLTIPGITDRFFSARDWMTYLGAPVLELNGPDGKFLEEQCLIDILFLPAFYARRNILGGTLDF